jgi:hypothetical protein
MDMLSESDSQVSTYRLSNSTKKGGEAHSIIPSAMFVHCDFYRQRMMGLEDHILRP